jgi:hypothetical protein
VAARIKVSTLVLAVGLLASSAGCSELIIVGGLTSPSAPITVRLPAD